MDNMMNTKLWYAGDANNDKYVTCMASKIEEIRRQGVTVACKWLEVTGNLELRKRFSFRRRYWLLTVRLKYAEWIGSEVHVGEIREVIRQLLEDVDDLCISRMYQALDIACFLSLYRISDGRIVPMFQQYHQQLLHIVDDFMAIEHERAPGKSFVEDCSRVFDIIADIENICGSKLYQRQLEKLVMGELSSQLLHFNKKQEQRLASMTTYFTSWVSNGAQSSALFTQVFRAIDLAKQEVDAKLSVNTDALFYEGSTGELTTRKKIRESRDYMLQALELDGAERNYSFWKLYIELIIKQSLEVVKRLGLENVTDRTAVRKTAYWSFHEKIHNVIQVIAGEPKYIKQLVEKKRVKSDSLLYGVFSTLAMKQVPVIYCEYDVINDINPILKQRRYKGGFRSLIEGSIESIFREARSYQNIGFCIEIPKEDAKGTSLEIACVYTDKQLVVVGIPESFKIGDHAYTADGGILGGLIDLVGFGFLTNKVLVLQDSSELKHKSRCQLACARFQSCDVALNTGLVRSLMDEDSFHRCDRDSAACWKNDSFAEVVAVAKGA